MSQTTRLDLNLLLPDVPDTQDACVGRLLAAFEGLPGIEEVHVVQEEGKTQLCLHYDPDVVPLADLERRAQAAGSEVTTRYGHALLPIRSIGAEDASRRIESALQGQKGVMVASVSVPAQVVRVEWDRTETTRAVIEGVLMKMGVYAPVKRAIGCCDHDHEDGEADGHDHDHEHDHDKKPNWFVQNRELSWSLGAGAVLAGTWLAERFAGLPHPFAIGLYALSYLFGGWDLASHWTKSAFKGKFTFDIDLLMLLAAIGAAILGDWPEGAFLLFLFSLAHALEHLAMDRARNAIEALSELTPDVARVRRDGKDLQVPIEEVRLGETVIVLPGERLPVDGKVTSGSSAVNQAPITGESVPVEKAAGAGVFAGTINGEGVLEIKVERAAGERTLDRVIRMVEEAQTQKAPTERFVDRFSAILVPSVLVADVLLICVPPLLGLLPWADSFYRGMALLVAASPCALALGTPSAVLAGIAQAARHGILVKGGAHLENLGNVRAMAFDKTGTLTMGRPEVTDVVPFSGVSASELLGTAASVEKRSQHPLAEAVVRRAESDGLTVSEDVAGLQSVTGKGVRATLEGKPVEIGSLKLWDAVPDEIRNAADTLAKAGKSVMAVRAGERWLGTLGVADEPRPKVRETLDALRKLGVKPLVMLTGDNQGVGEAIGKSVGVDEVRAELMPEDKVTVIRDLMAKHGLVAMTGDGVNDAPALANATVGIAMGGAGTAVALETADVALMADDLGKLPYAVALARRSSATIRGNLTISLGVILVLVITTTTGLLRIGPAVFFHEGSTLVVIANSLRLLAFRETDAL
ncbi:heavy metal translocating P-type ATPase [soil metagenome]